MFTGIIKATSKVLRSSPSQGKLQVTIVRPSELGELATGASIACDGICLTVLGFDSASFTVELMRETAQKTTAGQWKTNTILNLEPALKLGDRLDGHWVQGHIDRTSTLLEKRILSGTTYLRFELDPQDRNLVVPQGSIAVNGVSLTIAELRANSFTVSLISHPLDSTKLGTLSPGNKVNLEYDILGKYVIQLHQSFSRGGHHG